jgi:dephospho-CoA kinase
MLKVGLTGGVATGKSTVADVLRQKGCEIVDADRLGHAAIDPRGPAYDAVVAEFGPQILGTGCDTGKIARPKLAAIVFGNPERLARLNALVHPAIVELIERQCRAFLRRNPRGILVVDAALILEAGMKDRLQKLIVVDCDPEQQVARFVERGLGTAEEARRRIAAQMPREKKLAAADYIVDSSGTIEQTRERAEQLYEDLRKLV